MPIPEVPPELRQKVEAQIRKSGSKGILIAEIVDQLHVNLRDARDAANQLERDDVVVLKRGRYFVA